jgi:hypothetical protein
MPTEIIKQVRGVRFTVGGEVHSGWLPEGAAEPHQTPERVVTADVRIESDGASYFLICDGGAPPPDSWDTWHATLEEAEATAEEALGIRLEDWMEVGNEPHG